MECGVQRCSARATGVLSQAHICRTATACLTRVPPDRGSAARHIRRSRRVVIHQSTISTSRRYHNSSTQRILWIQPLIKHGFFLIINISNNSTYLAIANQPVPVLSRLARSGDLAVLPREISG
jgi:hypothetical protein